MTDGQLRYHRWLGKAWGVYAFVLFLLVSTEGTCGIVESINASIDVASKQWKLPGVALTIIKDDTVVYSVGHGTLADSVNRPFALGAFSETLTAAAVAQLVDMGKLSWQTKLSEGYPHFTIYDPYVSLNLTVEDVLSHRSGLGINAIGRDLLLPDATFLSMLHTLPVESSFRYSFGRQQALELLVRGLIHRLAPGGWKHWIDEMLFIPLGMKDTEISYTRPPSDLGGQAIARGKGSIGDATQRGDIVSTVNDIAQWLRCLLGKGRYGPRQIISASSAEKLLTPVVPLSAEDYSEFGATVAGPLDFHSFGLGWDLRLYRGERLASHHSNDDSGALSVIIVPKARLGVIVRGDRAATIATRAVAYSAVDIFMAVGGL